MANRRKYHGLVKGTPEYLRAQRYCRKYKISYQEYLDTIGPRVPLVDRFESPKVYRRHMHLKHNYGMTLDDYDKMLSNQQGVCAICGLSSTEPLAVDHCHNTGKVRSLLCRHCNLILGLARDNTELLEKAKNYLEKYK